MPEGFDAFFTDATAEFRRVVARGVAADQPVLELSLGVDRIERKNDRVEVLPEITRLHSVLVKRGKREAESFQEQTRPAFVEALEIAPQQSQSRQAYGFIALCILTLLGKLKDVFNALRSFNSLASYGTTVAKNCIDSHIAFVIPCGIDGIAVWSSHRLEWFGFIGSGELDRFHRVPFIPAYSPGFQTQLIHKCPAAQVVRHVRLAVGPHTHFGVLNPLEHAENKGPERLKSADQSCSRWISFSCKFQILSKLVYFYPVRLHKFCEVFESCAVKLIALQQVAGRAATFCRARLQAHVSVIAN